MVDADIEVIGLETNVVSISNEGMAAIVDAFGVEWARRHIAAMNMRSEQTVTGFELAQFAATASLRAALESHRQFVINELAYEMARRIEPTPSPRLDEHST